MSQQERKFFSGSTLEQALIQAASHFGVGPDEIAYTQLEKKHGFLRKRRGVIIQVDPESPTRAADNGAEQADDQGLPSHDQKAAEMTTDGAEEIEMADGLPEADADEQVQTSPPPVERGQQRSRERRERRPVEIDDEVIAAANEALVAVFEVSGLSLHHEVKAGDDRLDIELEGDDEEVLLEERGNLLLAIQHLMPRLIRGLSGRSVPCRVDADNFHENHEKEIQDLAMRIANEVKDRLETRTLHPMNPAERRIVHLALADDQDVDTESQGRGFFKRVAIRPLRRRPRGFDRYS